MQLEDRFFILLTFRAMEWGAPAHRGKMNMAEAEKEGSLERKSRLIFIHSGFSQRKHNFQNGRVAQ